MGFFFGNASNNTQENSKDAPKEEAFKKLQEENASLKENLEDAEKKLRKLEQSNSGELKALRQAKDELATENDKLNNQLNSSQKQVKLLENDKQVLNNEKIELTNKITELSKENDKLEQKHAPYDKLEKLYEVFLEVKECLSFEFVKDTHSAMDLIGHVLSDSKYYVEEFYKKTQQELRNKNSDKGEKLVALFDLLFECIKDKKFKRLEAPRSYNSACITLYPEQSSTGNIQRVVLRGYSYNDKIMHSIVDMGG
ncbi:hypothetical protein KVK48_00300 [Helicobacter pylori]|nr:hypothetical protein KVK48_00300 [Helicobacter pylori]